MAQINKKLQKVRERLRSLQKERRKLQRIFYRDEEMIGGSYGEVRICCGNPGCHCHRDGGHLATKLQQWINGKLKNKIVRIADRERVGKAAANYKAHKTVLREIRQLNKEELELLKQIVELRTKKYE